jgi:hypothetical protein
MRGKRQMRPRLAFRLEPARVWKGYGAESRSPRRRIKRIAKATIRARAVPKSSRPPRAPGLIIIDLAVGVPRLDRRTISADGGPGCGNSLRLPSHCRPDCQGENCYAYRNFQIQRHESPLYVALGPIDERKDPGRNQVDGWDEKMSVGLRSRAWLLCSKRRSQAAALIIDAPRRCADECDAG